MDWLLDEDGPYVGWPGVDGPYMDWPGVDGPYVGWPGVDGPYVDWPGVDGPYVDWPGVAGLNMSLSRSTLPTDWGCWKSSPRSWYLKQKLLEDTFEMQA